MSIKLVEVSAPHRLDIGGTWDLTPLTMLGRKHSPLTITISLDLRTRVTIERTGLPGVTIESNGPGTDPVTWSGTTDDHDYTGSLGMIQAVVSFFNLSGVKITINTVVPPRLGLGGSGTLCVALIAACMELTGDSRGRRYDNIAMLAHELEDGLFSWTGYQDQLAALHGGVKLWEWRHPLYSSRLTNIMGPGRYMELEERLVIARIGEHISKDINDMQVQSFLKPATRRKWVDINGHTKAAADGIRAGNWEDVTSAIRSEHQIRNELVPARIRGMDEYIAAATDGAFATAGSGQAVCWFLGNNKDAAASTRAAWGDIGADIIPARISADGLR